MKAALLFVALGVSSLQAGESVALVARHTQGDVFEEKESFWRSASGASLGTEDNKPAFGWNTAAVLAVERAGEQVRASDSTILDEVLSVKDGKRVKVKRTFLVSTSTLVDTAGAESTPRLARAAFEGQSVVLVADGDGTRIVGELDGEEELEASDLGLCSRWEQVLPAAPVASGETWSLSEDASRSLLEGMSVAKATAWCTLDGVDARTAGKPARIKLVIRATTSARDEGTSEIEASGTVLWSTEAGHLMEAALSGEIQTTKPDGSDETSKFGLTHEVRKLE